MKVNVSKIINTIGGQSEVARKLGIKQPSISGWVTRGKIPLSRVHQILKLSKGIFSEHDLRPDFFKKDKK